MAASKRFEMHGNIYNTSSFQGLQRLKYVFFIYSEMQYFLDFFLIISASEINIFPPTCLF